MKQQPQNVGTDANFNRFELFSAADANAIVKAHEELVRLIVKIEQVLQGLSKQIGVDVDYGDDGTDFPRIDLSDWYSIDISGLTQLDPSGPSASTSPEDDEAKEWAESLIGEKKRYSRCQHCGEWQGQHLPDCDRNPANPNHWFGLPSVRDGWHPLPVIDAQNQRGE